MRHLLTLAAWLAAGLLITAAAGSALQKAMVVP